MGLEYLEISPDFSVTGLVLALPLVAYLALVDPWLGRRMYATLERNRDADPGALTRYYGRVIVIWWGLAAVPVAVLLSSPGVAPADLGLAPPNQPYVTAGFAIFFAGAVLLGGRNMRQRAGQGKNVPGLTTWAALLPRTPGERRLAAGFAVTDGICANLVYRGLLIALFHEVLGLGLYGAAGVAIVVFALSGVRYGLEQLLLLGVWGVVMTAAYVATGSLLLPVLIHVMTLNRDLLALTAALHPERTREREER